MGTEAVKEALTKTTTVATKAPTHDGSFPSMLEAWKGEIARALPKHLSAERMIRIALTSFRKTPALANCDPRSVFAAVIQAAQLGLEPDTLGRSYLIPYGKEAQFVPGWRGLIDLVNRAGNASVWTGAVFEGDEFDYALGDRPFISHKPGIEDDPEKILYVYAVGRVKGSEWPVIEVWSVKKVWKHRDRFNKVGKSHYSFKHPEMYARKVVLLQVLKYMPASPELLLATALSYGAEEGRQGLTITDAVNGTWSGPVVDIEDTKPETKREVPNVEPDRKPESHKSKEKPKDIEEDSSPIISTEQYEELLLALRESTKDCTPTEKKEVMNEGLKLFGVLSIRDIPAERFEEALVWAKGGLPTITQE